MILEENIRLVASQVMGDVPEGGGSPTSKVIVDGQENTIFDDISELDRAGGRVNLRKIHVAVLTDNTDGFFGVNVIVSEPPKDPRVAVSLFSTKEVFDRRVDAANRVESYLFSGPEWNGWLLENHIAGQRTIQLLQRPATELPPIGHTLALIQHEGLATEYSQYIGIIDVSYVVREFPTDDGKMIPMWVVSCELSDGLRYDFPGTTPVAPKFLRDKLKTLTRDTRVTDAARYYGVSTLSEDASIGDFKVNVASVFTQLVPSAQTEIPLANQSLSGEAAVMVASGERGIKLKVLSSDHFGDSKKLILPSGCYPGTFYATQDTWDNGFGVVYRGANPTGTINYETGEVLFDTGTGYVVDGTEVEVTYKPATAIMQQRSTRFMEVTQESRRYNWIESLIPIPAPGTLSFAYMAQGNWYLLIDNGAGELRGSHSAHGAGTISYITGNMQVTTGALPDSGSLILLTWATPVHYKIHTDALRTIPGWEFQAAPGVGFEKGSVRVVWEANGEIRSLQDNSLGVLLGDGVGTVSYSTASFYFKPSVLPEPGTTPFLFYKKEDQIVETFTPNTDGNGFVTVNLTQVPVKPSSIKIEWETIRSKTVTERVNGTISGVSYFTSHDAYVDGLSLRHDVSWSAACPGYYVRAPYYQDTGGSAGSSSYTDEEILRISQKNSYRRFSEHDSSDNETNVVIQKIAFDYNGEISGPQAGSADYATGALRFIPTDIARTASWGLQSSGAFSVDGTTSDVHHYDATWAGSDDYQRVYEGGSVNGVSSSAGTTVRRDDTVEGSAGQDSTAASGDWGSESFKDVWGNGSLIKVTYVKASNVPLTVETSLPAKNIVINLTPMSAQQIIPGSVLFSFAGDRYVDRNGIIYRGVSPKTGSGLVAGSINYTTGEVTLTSWISGVYPTFSLEACLTRQGSWLVAGASFRTGTAPLKTQALQLTATAVDGTPIVGSADGDGNIIATNIRGKVNYAFGTGMVVFGSFGEDPNYTGAGTAPIVWVVRPVEASSIRYNAVAYNYLPLDASLLGLDTVRLPQDGRVPIFRKGEFAVLGHTGKYGPAYVVDGMTLSVGRTRISRVRIVGADGTSYHTGYDIDLDAGVVTFTDVSGYFQPIVVEHRIEDMAMISDVQIDGKIAFTRPISHHYNADESYLSSALVAGDLRARVSVFFDQASWDGSWSDNLVGNAATATYNIVSSPVVVTNAGAITERWVLRMTNATSFEVIGEHVGVVLVGNTATECSPINPATESPYFTISALGWGLGWGIGNVIRLNTVGAGFPVWVVRSIQQGIETLDKDSFALLVRGDIDRP